MTRVTGLALLSAQLCSCMTTSTQYVTRRTGQEEVILESARNLPPAMGDFIYEQGVVHGHVGWTDDCRRAVVYKQVADVVQVRTPNKKLAVATTVWGAAMGVASVALFAAAANSSDHENCSTDQNGYYSCSTARSDLTAVGVVSAVASAALIGASVATFESKPRSAIVDVVQAAPVVSEILEENTSCGSRPIEGLGLSLVRDGATLASASTNIRGDVEFLVPFPLSGGFLVVVNSVPPPIVAIHVDDIVGTLQVEPPQQRGPSNLAPPL